MEPEARRNTEHKGRGVFTFGTLLILFVGLPVTIIGLSIGFIWEWFLFFWVGLVAIAIGISCSFCGLIAGAGVATTDAREAFFENYHKEARNPMNGSQEVIFLKDNDWNAIDGEICRVLEFIPLATMRDGRVEATDDSTPYATVVIECRKIEGIAKGFIAHKIDFAMLWAAFNAPSRIHGVRVEVSYEPEQDQLDREVWLIWTKKRYKPVVGLFKAVLPRLIVMVCPKGAYELATDPRARPELSGEARFLAERPFVTWVPKVMKY